MHDLQKEFTKDNIDTFLKEFAKEYKKQYGKYNEIDIILVGGAAVLTNYNFRAMTTDIDAYSSRKHAVKEISNRLSDKLDLPYDWFNSDFENTKSFTPKLIKYAKPYRTFSNVVHFYTISQEYLIAMKLMSGREYKNDLSDVAEIIYEHKSSGNAISLERIEKAIFDLYDSFDNVPIKSLQFLENIYNSENIAELIEEQRKQEKINKNILVKFESEYPNVLSEDNIDKILNHKRKKDDFEICDS